MMKKTKINLLGPQSGKTKTQIQLPKKRYKQSIFVLLFAFVIIVFEVAFLFTFYQNLLGTQTELSSQKEALGKQLLSLQNEVSSLRSSLPVSVPVPTFDFEVLEEDASKQILNTVLSLGDQIPKNAWMSYLAVKDLKITVQGYALHQEEISTFMKSLEKIQKLKNVQLVLAEKSFFNQNPVHKFTITCDMEKI